MVEWHTSNVLVRVRFPAPAQMFNIEQQTEYLEADQEAKAFWDRQSKTVETLLSDLTRRLGEGYTAEVCFFKSNKKLCLKILKTPEELQKNIDDGTLKTYIPINEEMQFLSELYGIDSNVMIPKPLLVANSLEVDERFRFMLMERLNAVTVRDVLSGKEKLPESFNADLFYRYLMDFVERMHDQGIYHRDLHGGNIMIDIETGKPCVIDFGASHRAFGEEDPYAIQEGAKTFKFTSDESMVRKACKDLRELVASLTRNK